MCGRFCVTAGRKEIAERFGVTGKLPACEPNANQTPGQNATVVLAGGSGGRRLELMRWGLTPPWAVAGRALLINARAESLAHKPTFQTLLAHQRCLVPVNGFYEWRKLPGGRKQPLRFALPDNRMFALAGLWSSAPAAADPNARAFTLVTTAANALISPLHDRMPVVLAPDAEAAWLAPADAPPAELLALLQPCPAEWLQGNDATDLLRPPRANSVQPLLPF